MKLSLPSRKELNENRMKDLVSTLAEFKGGDHVIIGDLFWQVFGDLSAAKQEGYIRQLTAVLKIYRGSGSHE